MEVVDENGIGPGTPQVTVAGAAAHRAGLVLGYNPRFEGPSSRVVAEAVRSVVATLRQKITRDSRKIRNADEDAGDAAE